jgi:MFS family permease
LTRARSTADRYASWRILGHRRFRLYFMASMISNLGTWLQNTAQMLLAYQLTHSAFAVGLITAAQFSGFLVLGPWAGKLADRMGQKRVLIATQLLSALVAAALAAVQISGRLTENELICGALGTGLALTFAVPIQSAMVSVLVPERHTRAAMAMNSVSYNAGRTLAPVLYLVVLTSVGAEWAFAMNAASFVLFAVTVATLYPYEPTPEARPAQAWSGLRLAVHRPRIMLLLAMVAAITIADDPILVLGPSVAHQLLRVSSTWPAFFLSGLGLGTVLGVLLPFHPVMTRAAAIALGVLGLSVLVFALGISAWLSLAATIVAGTAALVTGASAQTMLLHSVSQQHATQVMALWAVAWAGSKPIASLADGWLASGPGVRWAAGILVTPAIVVAILELMLGDKPRHRLRNLLHRYRAARSAAWLS